MKKNASSAVMTAIILFLLFLLFTVCVMTLDVRPIGPAESSVGLASLNGAVFSACGSSVVWDKISDLAGLAAFAVAAAFALLGLVQLIRRRSLTQIDRDLYVLAGIYLLAMGFYVFFELFPVNCRPILVDGALEASYPSSHTFLALCILLTAIPSLGRRLKRPIPRRICTAALLLIGAVITLGRLLSGMHWLSDIVGAILLAAALSALCTAVTARVCREGDERKN